MHCMLRPLERLRSSPFARHHASGIDDNSLMIHLRGILQARLTDSVKAIIRRLAFEAQALALQDLKSKLERTSDSALKVLLQEKSERIREQQSRLSGINFTSHNSPSHRLIDKVTQQADKPMSGLHLLRQMHFLNPKSM